jgi:putative transposase
MEPQGKPLPQSFFFVTAAVGGWKHLFANEACARIVFDSLDHLRRTRKLELYAFALLPSHLMLLCRPAQGAVGRVLDGFADFTAARIAGVLRRRGRGPLMHYLHEKTGAGGPGAPIWGKLDLREIGTVGGLLAALERIHNKPTAPEWRLAPKRSEYVYSSACFYDLGREPIIPVLDARREVDG